MLFIFISPEIQHLLTKQPIQYLRCCKKSSAIVNVNTKAITSQKALKCKRKAVRKITKIHENYVPHECQQLHISYTLLPFSFIIFSILNIILSIASFPCKSPSFQKSFSGACQTITHHRNPSHSFLHQRIKAAFLEQLVFSVFTGQCLHLWIKTIPSVLLCVSLCQTCHQEQVQAAQDLLKYSMEGSMGTNSLSEVTISRKKKIICVKLAAVSITV